MSKLCILSQNWKIISKEKWPLLQTKNSTVCPKIFSEEVFLCSNTSTSEVHRNIIKILPILPKYLQCSGPQKNILYSLQ